MPLGTPLDHLPSYSERVVFAKAKADSPPKPRWVDVHEGLDAVMASIASKLAEQSRGKHCAAWVCGTCVEKHCALTHSTFVMAAEARGGAKFRKQVGTVLGILTDQVEDQRMFVYGREKPAPSRASDVL